MRSLLRRLSWRDHIGAGAKAQCTNLRELDAHPDIRTLIGVKAPPGRVCSTAFQRSEPEEPAMTTTETERKLIRKTYAAAREKIEEASTAFYDRVLAQSDQMRAMFRGDMTDQRMRFMTALGVIVGTLDRPDELGKTLSHLGSGHAALGVRPAHYQIMNAVLIATLADYAGETWSADAEAAWQRALTGVADAMMGVEPGVA
ncbi:MAG: globin domain-containing protein [Pseudomonadota bacterium]